MRGILILIGVLAALTLPCDLFIWLVAHASHNIPAKTDWGFGLSNLVLLIIVLLCYWGARRLRLKEQEDYYD